MSGCTLLYIWLISTYSILLPWWRLVFSSTGCCLSRDPPSGQISPTSLFREDEVHQDAGGSVNQLFWQVPLWGFRRSLQNFLIQPQFLLWLQLVQQCSNQLHHLFIHSQNTKKWWISKLSGLIILFSPAFPPFFHYLCSLKLIFLDDNIKARHNINFTAVSLWI